MSKAMFMNLYGNYRTRSFSDIFPDLETFMAQQETTGLPLKINEDSAAILYYLLYSKYGNSHIASMDEHQFVCKLFATVFMYGPAWEKKLDIQDKLRALTEDELLSGSAQVMAHEFNQGVEVQQSVLNPTQDPFTPNERHTTAYKKAKLEAYSTLEAVLDTDVTEPFLAKFKKLFLTIVEPELPLWYFTQTEVSDDD